MVFKIQLFTLAHQYVDKAIYNRSIFSLRAFFRAYHPPVTSFFFNLIGGK